MIVFGTKLELEIPNTIQFQTLSKVGSVKENNLIVHWACKIRELLKRMTIQINYRLYLS